MKINWFKYCKMTPNYYKKNKLIKKKRGTRKSPKLHVVNGMWLTAMSNYSLYKLFYINYIWKYV